MDYLVIGCLCCRAWGAIMAKKRGKAKGAEGEGGEEPVCR
jgi:hypothetical protein